MATWDEINKKAGGSTPTTGGGFSSWDALNKSAIRPAQINEFQRQANISAEEAKKSNSFFGLAKETAKDVGSIVPNFFRSLYSVYKETPSKLVEDVKAGAEDIQMGKLSDFVGINTPKNILGVGGSTGKGLAKSALRTSGDAAIAIFAPISAAIGAVLEKSGGQKIIDKAGNVIADKSGITDLPAFQKFAMEHPNAGLDFERILTIAMSGLEKGKIGDSLKKPAETLVNNVRVPVTSESTQTSVPVKTPSTKHSEYAKTQGYEPYTSAEQLPIIQMGAKAKSELPAIQTQPRATKGEFTYEPVKQFTSWNDANTAAVKAPETVRFKSDIQAESGLVKTLKEDAAAKGIVEDLGQTPAYDVRRASEFAPKAQALVESDINQAIAVARGKAPAPDGLLTGEVFSALKTKAIESGDVDLLRLLATDKDIAGQATAAGQAVKAYDVRLANDPVRAISDVSEARIQAFEKRTGKSASKIKENVMKDVQKEINKQVQLKPKTWADFINSLEC